jgi:hypothetical protein
MRRILVLICLISFSLTFTVNVRAAKYAVLICGGVADADDELLNSEFWYDLFLAYEDLVLKEGFTHDNIYVCYGNGTSFNSNHNRFKLSLHGWPEIVDYDNRKATIFSLFDNLGDITTDLDHILIRWVVGHGRTDKISNERPWYSKDNYRAMLDNQNDSILDSELIEHIGNIDHYTNKLIFSATCHSGCLLTGEKRLDGTQDMVMTACQWWEKSEGMPTESELYHARFNYYCTGFLYGGAPKKGYASDKVYDGDDNGDGFITMDELFDNTNDSTGSGSHPALKGCDDIENDLVIGGRIHRFLHNRTINYTGDIEGYKCVEAAGGGTYCTVESNGSITMRAPQYILLRDGFHAKEGCFVDCRIEPIGSVSSTALTQSEETEESEKDSEQDDIIAENQEEIDKKIPTEFSCSQNYPNPFNSSTTIKYGLPVDSDISLTIYNLLGQRVKTVNMKQSAGYKSFTWDRTDNAGNIVGSGMYFYVLKAGDKFQANKKMLVLK